MDEQRAFLGKITMSLDFLRQRGEKKERFMGFLRNYDDKEYAYNYMLEEGLIVEYIGTDQLGDEEVYVRITQKGREFRI